jgi:hypothetical protein
MKSKILIAVLIAASFQIGCNYGPQKSGQALQELQLQKYFEWDHPNRPFTTELNSTHSNIKWITADNVLQACDKESRRRGFGGFGNVRIAACSFYVENECTIITAKTPTMHTVGHEVRHCFQGQWHD